MKDILARLTPYQNCVLSGLVAKYGHLDARFNSTELFPIEEINGPHDSDENELRVAKGVHNNFLENAGKTLDGGWK